MTALLNYLTRIHFGPGAVREIPDLLQSHGIQRPLLVTDTNLVAVGLPDRLPVVPAAVFSEVPGNPTEGSVLSGVTVYRESECDGIIALGGGSPIDCAKCISLLVTHSPPLNQYAVIQGGLTKITSAKPPVIAVPTTAGTGSEVGRAALISFASGEKLGLISPHMIPTEAVCDPELTLELPPYLTAATGMDAVSHCVETFCSNRANPVADAIALDGLGRAFRNLRKAVAVGSLDSRTEMMMASLQGGLTFQKGLGMIHSLSHPLGALPHRPLHHGTLNAVFLPHVLRFNSAACPGKMQALALVIGLTDSRALAESFERLNRDIGLPSGLQELGVTPADLSGIPKAAMKDHSTPSNPREMTLESCEALLKAAM